MSSANPPSEQIIREVRDLLACRSNNAQVADSSEPATRTIVAAQLIAAMSGPDLPERERARELFTNHGYLEETISSLRTAESPTQRATHAEILGMVGSRLTTAHLVAALFDSSPEVCRAAAEALTRIGDPAVALGPLNSVLSSGTDQIVGTEEDLDDANLDLLRRKEAELDRAVATIAIRRIEVKNARQEADAQLRQLEEEEKQIAVTHEARRAEAERRLVEAEDRHRAEQEKLREQEELVRRATELVLRRQAEIDAARKQAEEIQLGESQQQTKTAEEIRRKVAEDRFRLETEAQRRAEDEHRLLENARHRFAQEQQRLEEEASRRAAEEEARVAELEALRANMETEARERARREQQILHEIKELERAEAEQRNRIQGAEARLRAAGESYAAETYRLAETEKHTEAEEEASSRELEKAQRPPHAPESARIQTMQGLITIDSASSNILHANHEGLDSLDPLERARALAELAWSGAESELSLITKFVHDVSPDVRSVAARVLYELAPQRCVEIFSRTLEEGSSEQWRNIGEALVASGLAERAIEQLVGDNREDTYNALCLLFVMAKTGEVQPLIRAIEEHKSVEVRSAAVKLLTLNGQAEIAAAAAKRRLMVR